MNVPAIHGGLLKPDVVEVWRLPCWDLTETSKRDDGIDLLKDNQALQRLTGTDDKAKMDLSSLTQTNIRMVEVICELLVFFGDEMFLWIRHEGRLILSLLNTWLVCFGAHSSFRWDEMMSLGSNLMDVNVALIKTESETDHLHSVSDSVSDSVAD
ncbi:hypothetical protein Syun_028364 [Stephania yunnanensis]|uniref:Uncharacterized protein n=1 Tax=Stephania yunnanensis TaxID=152371 RepID=A0AAP0EMV2_9MAGN